MTRDEILKLEAGEELDALIATEVMGWIRRMAGNAFDSLVEAWYSRDEEGYMQYPVAETYCEFGSVYFPFCPSADMSDAWEVVEKMGAYKLESVFRSSGTKQKAIFWHGMIAYSAEAETSSLAICRASLLTILDK